MKTGLTRLLDFPIYPLLLAMYPVVYISANNPSEILLHHTLGLSLTLAVFALLVLWLARLGLRDWERAGVMTASIVFSSLFYGHLYQAIQRIELLSPILRHRVLLPLFGLTALLATAALLKASKGKKWSPVANTMALVLVGLAAIPLVVNTSQTRAHAPSGTSPLSLFQPLPDVFFIVIDEFPRTDVLRSTFGTDNSAFDRGLRDLGFVVAAHSHANYSRTIPSLAATLNMNYLPETGQREIAQSDYDSWLKTIQQSAIIESFKATGYRIEVMTNCAATEGVKSADAYVRSTMFTGDLSLALQKGSILSAMRALSGADRAEGDWQHRMRVEAIYQNLQACKPGPPTFRLVHILCPHAPFVFKSDGSWIAGSELGGFQANGEPTLKSYRTWYPEQVVFTSQSVLKSVKSILQNYATAPVKPIVLVVSDHGSQSEFMKNPYKEWKEPSPQTIRERLPNFVAILAPGVKHKAVEHLSLVNLFPVALNLARKPLPDRMYFVGHQILDVTSVLAP